MEVHRVEMREKSTGTQMAQLMAGADGCSQRLRPDVEIVHMEKGLQSEAMQRRCLMLFTCFVIH